ncbi:hypothetical protein I317_06536 [Kwoniella heveanensis CBS 569]|nr:hypothetical protein I317_06536 [Kwoniella heveanensis CBS 569]
MIASASTSALFPSSPAIDHLRPSLFDLLAQEQLRDLFHPVVRYVLSYFAQRYPRYLLRVLNHHEEFFALLLLLLERHHLKKHNASISEHFYGLRSKPTQAFPRPRLTAFEGSTKRNLTRKQRWGLLFFLVGLPYVRARGQDYFERLGGGQGGAADEDGGERGLAATKTERVYKTLYPYVNAGVDLVFLGYDIAYLFEKTNSYRPWHRWLDIQVSRRGPEDDVDDNSGSLLSKLPPLLPPLLLMLKLSQWWYSPASPRSHPSLTAKQNTTAATHAAILPPRALPILPSSGVLPLTPPLTPPADDEQSAEQHQLGASNRAISTGAGEDNATVRRFAIGKETYGKCPLCGKRWQNPAVLPSGWVVCWRCGWDAVEGEEEDEDEGLEDGRDENDGRTWPETGKETPPIVSRRKGRCPITGMRVAPGQLRRVLV